MSPLLITFGIIAIPLLLFVGATGIFGTINKHRAANLVSHQQALRDEQVVQATQDAEGGTTPGETLARFAEAVGRKDGDSAAALAVPALRDHLRTAIRGMSAEDAVDASEKIRDGASSAEAFTPGHETYAITEPVYVELVRYPSGAWKVASF